MNSYLWPVFGGILIGLSAALLLLLLGRIAGISSIIWGAISQKITRNRSESRELNSAWNWFFLVGIMLGTFLFHQLTGKPIPAVNSNYFLAIAAGLFVGVGVKTGSGCTSGHGVCGIGRLSPRSIVATLTFMIVAIITVAIVNF